MKRKLVMHIITGLSVGGAEKMLLKLLKHSDAQKFEHIVISLTSGGGVAEEIRMLGLQVKVLNMSGVIRGVKAIYDLLKIIRNYKPSIIQTWMYHADLIGGIVARLLGIKNVVWNIRNGSLSKGKSTKSTILIMRVSAFLSGVVPKKIITCSYDAMNIHTGIGYDPGKIMVIPNGFDSKVFFHNDDVRKKVRDRIGITQDSIIIAKIARYDPQKDHENFINAASILDRRLSNVSYLLCGDRIVWENDALVNLIDSLEMRDSFYLLGRRKDVSEIIAASDIVSLTSSFGEAFPNVIGEALLCEVPCVATDVGDSARIIGNAGYIVPPNDSVALSEAWYKLIQMGNNKMRSLGSLGRKSMIERYDIGRIATMYDDLYEDLSRV